MAREVAGWATDSRREVAERVADFRPTAARSGSTPEDGPSFRYRAGSPAHSVSRGDSGATHRATRYRSRSAANSIREHTSHPFVCVGNARQHTLRTARTPAARCLSAPAPPEIEMMGN